MTSFDSHSTLENPSDREIKYAHSLLFAAKQGRLAEIIRLIRVGAKASGINKQFDDDYGVPIDWAAFEGQVAAVDTLSKHGAPLDVRGKYGETPLSLATSRGHISVIRLLREKGAKLENQDNRGRTPLSRAAEYGLQEAVELLLKLGAEKEAKDNKSRTALWYAVSSGHIAVAATLLNHGADIENTDTHGNTPLVEAVRTGSHPLVKLLLARGALLSPERTTNCSLLYLASDIGSEGIVELLTDYGANPNHSCDKGHIPLAIAAKAGHSMVVKILIEAGADIHMRDGDGRNVLSYAEELRNESLVKLLSRAAILPQATGKVEREICSRRMKYKYRQIREGYIRILELDPGTYGDIITFELNDVDLSQNPYFEALSYEWKEKSGTIPVQCGHERLLVTPNCKAALQRIRHETDKKFLWIDALCINQEDQQECNQQVAMMTEIYRKARSVLMWMGEGNNATAAAFERIPRLCDIHKAIRRYDNGDSWEHVAIEGRPDVQSLVEDVLEDKITIDSLKSLLFSEYFKRAWIFQEIMLADTRGLVMCGPHQCSWQIFRDALICLNWIFGIGPPDPKLAAFHEIVRCEDSLRETGQLLLFNTSLAMTTFDASDARDKIFATLRLVSADDNEHVKPPVADYALTVQEVYVDASRYFIDVTNGVGIWAMTHRSSTKIIPNLPSWAADFTNPTEEFYSDPFFPKTRYRKFISGQPVTTSEVLWIDGCLLDKLAFKVSITRDMDVYDVIKQATLALARYNRSVYEPYLSHNPEQNTRRRPVTDSRRRRKKTVFRGKGATRKSRVENSRIGSKQSQVTNGHVLLDTILGGGRVEAYTHKQVCAFLAWKLSTDHDMPTRCKQAPRFLQQAVATWEARSKTNRDFDLDICSCMEDLVQWDTDLVYTEGGYFGLTNRGEAEEGMMVAIAGRAFCPVLLREVWISDDDDDTEEDDDDDERKEEEREQGYTRYEFVANIHLNHYGRNIGKLEDLQGDVTIQRLEIW